METNTPPPPPSSNGVQPPTETPTGASPDDMMKVLVRQHRVINSLKDQLASVLLGLAETQATVDELREDLAAAQNELESTRAAFQPTPNHPVPA